MNQQRHGVNTLQVGEVKLLLTVTSGGSAVHLAHVADPEHAGRAAVHDYYFDANRRSAPLELTYDRAALLKPRWAPTTLCGREWAVMIAGEGGPLSEFNDEVAFAPTCGHCLATMDKLFPAPAPDQRLPLLAKLGADTILEHGHAEVRDVPGDQQQALRTAVRTLVRQRVGESCRSYVHESVIFFVSEAIYAAHKDEDMRAAAEAIDRALAGGDPTLAREPGWLLYWDTWGVS